MLDVAAVAEQLLQATDLPQPLREGLVVLSALHDLGKIGAQFRAMLQSGIPQTQGRHWEVTEVLLNHHDAILAAQLGADRDARRQLYAAAAGHHGRPPTREGMEARRTLIAAGAEALADTAEMVRSTLSLWPEASLEGVADATALSWWLPGLVATADWVGSNSAWFEPEPAGRTLAEYLPGARRRAANAVAAAGLADSEAADRELFGFALRPMQAACVNITLPEGPTLAIIEDETGAGKTEAALILAQRMLLAGKGRGIFFALPTTATADAMFARARTSVGRLFSGAPTLTLAHGRSHLSYGFRELVAQPSPATDEPVCTEWLADDRRRALLGTVGVGTIDQALLSILPTRFSTLRHYALSSKILIVDEVHELGEPYLAQELAQLLRAQRMAGGSAILLTATLPLTQRRTLLGAWGATDDGDAAYPALTVAGGEARRNFPQVSGARGPVHVERLESAEAAMTLLEQSAGRGAACVWVRNAVDDAIAAMERLRARGVPASLLHARFTLADRLRHEQATLARFGKDGQGRAGQVLVATQVVESSLDLDFDVMVSDLAPVAALIQRAGRLWRHMTLRPTSGRPVPVPVLHVVSPDPAHVEDARWLHRVLDRGAWVYPSDQQWRTAHALLAAGGNAGRIDAPAGLRGLIEAVEAGDVPLPPPLEEAERQRIGQGYAATNQARRNMVVLEDGYRRGGAGAADTDYPTRLGRPQIRLMLARSGAEGLRPLSGEGDHGWALSEVQAAAARVARLPLPDQSAPEIAAVAASWPAWRRVAVTVCPVAEDGGICTGLRYHSDRGLVIEEP